MGKALPGPEEPLLDIVSLARRGPNGRLSPEEISWSSGRCAEHPRSWLRFQAAQEAPPGRWRT